MRKNIVLLLLGSLSISAINGQTVKDLNPIYAKIAPTRLSLLLRESPQTLKKTYGKNTEISPSTDTLMVAKGTESIYNQICRKMKWTLTPVGVPKDTAYTAPTISDSSLMREVNKVKFNMVKVEDSSRHKKYLIGQTEVTQRLWIAVMFSNPSEWVNLETSWPNYDQPVECVSREYVNLFIKKLNQLTNRHFRLPTAKEWEYAANGGHRKGTTYSGSENLEEVGWYKKNYIIGAGTQKVGLKKPNELGIYDMNGNVSEIVTDNFNRKGINYTLTKGGCANDLAKDCTTERKRIITTNTKSQFVGFRLAEDDYGAPLDAIDTGEDLMVEP